MKKEKKSFMIYVVVFTILSTVFLFGCVHGDTEPDAEGYYNSTLLALNSVAAENDDVINIIHFSDDADLNIIYDEEANTLQLVEIAYKDSKSRIVKTSEKFDSSLWEESATHTASFAFECESAFFELGLMVSKNPEDNLGPGEVYEMQNGYYLCRTKYKIAP